MFLDPISLWWKGLIHYFSVIFQENVPGSNEFAEQGANPLFQLAMESADFDDDMK